MKQYKAAPSKGNNITKNQTICFSGCWSSNRNKKNSIPTNVIPAPMTPANRSSLTMGAMVSGIPPTNNIAHQPTNNATDRPAEAR